MANLTIDVLMEAYDRVWDIPDEPHWYLCHPAQLERLRAELGRDYPGKHTCPLIRAHSACAPDKVLQIKHRVEPEWQWPWQRREVRP